MGHNIKKNVTITVNRITIINKSSVIFVSFYLKQKLSRDGDDYGSFNIYLYIAADFGIIWHFKALRLLGIVRSGSTNRNGIFS